MNSSPRSEPLDLSSRWLFITGGTGFIGRSLLDYLGESAARHGANFRATVLCRDPGAFVQRHPAYNRQPWLSFMPGDLESLPTLEAGVTDVIHAAADTHRVGDSLAWLQQLVQGTQRVLATARAARVQRLLFISSGAVYGSQSAQLPALEENLPQAPLPTDIAAVYAHGKRMAEQLCALYTAEQDLPCVIARCFAVISRHVPLDGPYAVGNFIRDALSPGCERIQVRGNGLAVRTYLDGRDMAHWMLTLLYRGQPGQAYNVGSDHAITVGELARRVGALLAPHKPVLVEHQVTDSQRSIYVPSIAKAQSIGLRVETPLEQAITEAAARGEAALPTNTATQNVPADQR